jgi:hypothetical protein
MIIKSIKILSFWMSLLAVGPLLGGCGGGGGNSSAPTPTSTPTYSLSGRVQKGPFAIGSEITVNLLDKSLSPTGTVYNTQTSDALGDFALSSNISTPLVEIVAQGFYFDEISAELSAAQIELRAISDLSVNNLPTVNVLTTLQEQRLKTLVSMGSTVAAASSQSANEVLSLFGINAASVNSLSMFDSMRIDGGTDQDAVLLAVSVILSQMATDSAKANGTTEAAELSNLVNTIAAGIASTGTLTSTTFVPAKNLANTEINAATLTANLQAYYAKNGATVTAPLFMEWVDQTNSGVLPQRLVPVNAVVFSAVTTANPAQSITSNAVTVGGVGTGVVVKVVASGGTTIIKNGVAVVGQLAIAQDGDTLALRVTALGTGQSTISTLSVGSTSVQWSVTSVPLGGPITGVTGTGLVLQDNLGDTVTVAAGSSTFGFSSMISNGQPYSITVITAPTSPLQSCAVINGSGIVGATQTPITVACSLASEIAVAANSTTNNISVYAVDPTTGALSPVPGSPFATGATPKSVAIDATGQYVLVANNGASNISVYSINTTNGFLTPVTGSPFATGTGPTGVTVDAVSDVVYVPESASDTIASYSINSTNGILTAISGSPFATPLEPGFGGVPQAVGNLSPAIIDTTGGYLYASYQYEFPLSESATGVLGYGIGANGGGLSLLPSNPFAIGSCFCIRPMAIAPNGHFLYQSAPGLNVVLGYSVDASTGALSALTGNPTAATGADSIVIDPTSSFLYVSDDTDIALLAYSINSTTGALTPLPGSPYPTGGEPNCVECSFLPTFVSIDLSGKYVYVQSEFTISSSIISAFSINAANGSLTPVPGSPFTTGANSEGLVGIAFAPIPQ